MRFYTFENLLIESSSRSAQAISRILQQKSIVLPSFLSLRSLLVGAAVILVVAKSRALHQLLLGALGTNDVLAVGDKASSDQRSFAARANEAIIMPVSIFERDETSAADA